MHCMLNRAFMHIYMYPLSGLGLEGGLGRVAALRRAFGCAGGGGWERESGEGVLAVGGLAGLLGAGRRPSTGVGGL